MKLLKKLLILVVLVSVYFLVEKPSSAQDCAERASCFNSSTNEWSQCESQAMTTQNDCHQSVYSQEDTCLQTASVENQACLQSISDQADYENQNCWQTYYGEDAERCLAGVVMAYNIAANGCANQYQQQQNQCASDALNGHADCNQEWFGNHQNCEGERNTRDVACSQIECN